MNTAATGLASIILACALGLGVGHCYADIGEAPQAVASSPVEVVTLELRENEVISIPTHPDTTVFVQFPAVISDYTGRGFTEDPAESVGEFLIRHLDGDSYLSVTPLKENVRRTLHVVCGGKGYPLEFIPAPADSVWKKVIFSMTETTTGAHARRGSRKARGEEGVARTGKPPARAIKELTTSRAIGVITNLRLLANLPEAKAQAVVGCNKALSFSVKGKSQDFGDFRVITHFVVRDSVYDALGFAVSLENKTRDALQFDPSSLTIRAGDHVYSAATADMNPSLAPKSKALVLFVVSGDGTGRPNRLSCENDFSISIDLVRRAGAASTVTLDIPRPAPNTKGPHD